MDNVGGVHREGNGHDEFVLRLPKVVKVWFVKWSL